MKYENVRGGAVFLIFCAAASLGSQADAGWGHRHHAAYGSSGYAGYGSYGSSGYAGYGSSGYSTGYASAGYGSSGYAGYGSYGSSGYASAGSSGYVRPTLGQRIHAHFAAKRARRAARRASYGSSGYYASHGGSSGYSASYASTGGSSGYSGGSSGNAYSSGVSYGSAGTSYGSVGAVSTGYYSARKASTQLPTSVVTNLQDDSVYLTVSVPSNTRIFVNDKPTTSTGRVREFVSRGLKPGSRYKFEIRAELESTDGSIMTEDKTLIVQAGQRQQLQFAFADEARPIETAVTLNVPEGAEVFLAGNETSATGSTRTFRTSKLRPGQTWDDYEIEVRHGEQVRHRSIRLNAGDQLQLTFAFDEASENTDLVAAR